MSDALETVTNLIVAGVMLVVVLGVIATLYGADASSVTGSMSAAVSIIVRVGVIGIVAVVILTVLSRGR